MSGAIRVIQPSFSVPVLEAPRIPRMDVSSGIEAVAEGYNQQEKQRDATDLLQARLQAQTKLTDLKFQTLKQPWQVRETFFQGQAQGILSDIQSNSSMSDRVAGMFAADWATLYQNHNIDVKTSAFEGEKDQNRANLDMSLEESARQAATASSEEQANTFRQTAAGQIAAAEGGGWITQQEGVNHLQDFARRMDQNRARIAIDASPSAGLAALQDPKQFQNLRAEDRIALTEHADAKIQHQMAVSDHAAIVAERNRKIAGDQLSKEGEDLIATGQMTEAWMQKNRLVLDGSDYRILRHAMQEGGGTDSSAVISQTYRDIYTGASDVAPGVLNALDQHLITPQTAKTLLDENKGQRGTPVSNAKAFITQYLRPSDINPTPAQAQSHAEAMAEFTSRLQQDPKQDPMALARDIVRRNGITEMQEMTLVMRLPTYFTGSRADVVSADPAKALLVIQAADVATTKAFLAKHGGDAVAAHADPEYQQQSLLIKKWLDGLNQQAKFHAIPATGGVK